MSATTLLPKESGEHIVKNAKYVRVLPEGIERLTQEVLVALEHKRIDVSNFSQHDLHPKPSDTNAVEWIFVTDTLNFCFWTPGGHTKYRVEGHSGYFALCAAINRVLREGVDLTNSQCYAKIDEDTLRKVFRSDDGHTNIPLFKERVACLHEVGARLLAKWQGRFENVVKAAQGSAMRLLQLIVEEFPCFRDEAEFAGKRVSLYKRAQILVGDLWACFQGKGIGAFRDIECITMFADYRVPQVLVHFGALKYNEELLAVLRREEILQDGDPMEVEIRGASIYAVEQVKEAVARKCTKSPDTKINSILIDHFLWDYRRRNATKLEHIPFHKVLSIYY